MAIYHRFCTGSWRLAHGRISAAFVGSLRAIYDVRSTIWPPYAAIDCTIFSTESAEPLVCWRTAPFYRWRNRPAAMYSTTTTKCRLIATEFVCAAPPLILGRSEGLRKISPRLSAFVMRLNGPRPSHRPCRGAMALSPQRHRRAVRTTRHRPHIDPRTTVLRIFSRLCASPRPIYESLFLRRDLLPDVSYGPDTKRPPRPADSLYFYWRLAAPSRRVQLRHNPRVA